MTRLHFCSRLWLALAAICFAPEAASSPPNPTALREYLHDDMFARGAVLLQSSSIGSSTVVAQSSATANSSATSFSPSHKTSLYHSSGNLTTLPNSTAVNSNSVNRPSSTNGASAALPTKSSSTALGLLLDDSSTPTKFLKSSSTTLGLLLDDSITPTKWTMSSSTAEKSLNDESNTPTLSTMSSSTGAAFLNDNSSTSTISNMRARISFVARSTNSTISTSSPLSTSGAAGAQVYRIRTSEKSPNRLSSASQASSSDMIPTTVTSGINPTNTAALAGGIALGGALLSFSKSAAQVGPDIVKPATKTAYLRSLETLESDLEDAFKDRGGVDPGAPCLAKRKRFRLRNRDLISQLLNDFNCAIDSVINMRIHLNVENPDLTVIEHDLEVIGTRAQDLETDEKDDEKITTSETTTESHKTPNSDLTSQRTIDTSKTSNSVPRSSASRTTTIATSNPTSQQTTTITQTLSSVSKTSASRSATVSSGQLSNATCYTGSEYLFPALATAPAANDGQSEAFQLANLALAKFFAMDPPMPFTAKSPRSTMANNSSITRTSSSEITSTFAQSSRSFVSSSKTNSAFSQSSTKSAYSSSPIPNAIPIPGQNGVAGCVYEIVADQEKLPAGTENYCYCAGGPGVDVASAPLLTHSPTSSGANGITDCAYTTQPTPGWTPSLTMTFIPTITPRSPAISSESIPIAASPACTVGCTKPSAVAVDE